MEEKKKGKGLKIVLAIFIILFLLTAGALGYGYTKYQKLKNDNTNLNTKYENANKDLNSTKSELDKANKDAKTKKSENSLNYVKYGYAENINVYAIYPSFMIFSVDDELYMAQDPSLNLEINVLQTEFKDLKFKNNVATEKKDALVVSDDDDKDYEIGEKEIYFTKLNISVNEVSKIIGKHADGFRDPTGEVYIFYKNGGLTHFTEQDFNTKKILTEYKIKDIEIIIDKKSPEGAVGGYKLILQDGTTKTIDKLK